MLSCFVDYIGLSYCPGIYEQPGSGLYLNSLPGISIKSIDAIANDEQTTYLGVWEDVQNSAVAQFRIDVISELNKCFKLNRDCDYDTLICDNKETLVQAWKYCLGVWLMIFRLNTDRLNQYTTVDRKQAEELKKFYQSEYDKALNQGVRLMNTEECCLECSGNPEVVYFLP
jgi:hypothetical protein